MYLACKAAKTKFICATEADCLYPPTGYFDFLPEGESGAYFYNNVCVTGKGEDYFRRKNFSLCAMFANREEIIERLERCLSQNANNNIWIPNLRKVQIPLFDGTKKMKFFTNDLACINFKTRNGIRWNTPTGKTPVMELPYWGKAEDLQREMFP